MRRKRRRQLRWGAMLAACAMLSGCDDGGGGGADGTPPLTIFAAASISPALEVAGRIWSKQRGRSVRVVPASSGALARQIENGAPADIFISAHPEWIRYLDERGLLIDRLQGEVARNSLVLIAPKSEAPPKDPLASAKAFKAALDGRKKGGRLAIGYPAQVPAGTYGKAALQSLGLWDVAEARLAPTGNVRAVLTLVERGEVPLGIVYRTDALASRRVVQVQAFPAESHPPVIYMYALVAGRPGQAAVDFIGWLRTPIARTVLEKAGFSVPELAAN